MYTVWKYSVLTAKDAPHLIHLYAHADSFANINLTLKMLTSRNTDKNSLEFLRSDPGASW